VTQPEKKTQKKGKTWLAKPRTKVKQIEREKGGKSGVKIRIRGEWGLRQGPPKHQLIQRDANCGNQREEGTTEQNEFHEKIKSNQPQ